MCTFTQSITRSKNKFRKKKFVLKLSKYSTFSALGHGFETPTLFIHAR